MADHPDISLADIKSQVSAWLDEHWRPDRNLSEWREILVEGGWAAPTWPEEYYGRNYSSAQAGVVADDFGRPDLKRVLKLLTKRVGKIEHVVKFVRATEGNPAMDLLGAELRLSLALQPGFQFSYIVQQMFHEVLLRHWLMRCGFLLPQLSMGSVLDERRRGSIGPMAI